MMSNISFLMVLMTGFLIGGLFTFVLSEIGFSSMVCVSEANYEKLLNAYKFQQLTGGKNINVSPENITIDWGQIFR